MRPARALVRPIVWLLSVALTLAGLSVTAPASADEVGGISGVVTGPDSQPLQGATVTAYQWNLVEGGWSSVANDTTDATGGYEIAALPPGGYRIGFGLYDGSGYLEEYWNDAASIESADEVTVSAGQTAGGKNAQLLLGGRIAGTITDPAGDPLLNGYVTAFRWDPAGESWENFGDDFSDASGAYELRGLVGGTYRLRFADSSGNGYLPEYWDGATTIDDGTTIPVAPGDTVTGKDAQLAAPGHISGTVTGTGAEALDDVEVTAYQWNDQYSYWERADSVYTDDDGHYDLGNLYAGTYRLGFRNNAGGGYLTEYWNDATTVETADDIAVTSGQVTADKDAQLATGSHVTGTVTDPGGAPLEDVYVSIHQWNDQGEYWESLTGVHTDTDGHYDVAGLYAGTYRLGFRDDSGDGYYTEYWNDAATVETADSIVVPAGTAISGKDAQLTAGGTITGAVTGDGGGPLDDVYVTAYRWDDVDESWGAVSSEYSDTDGTYALVGLSSGTYRLRFDDYSGGGYLPEYWDDAPTLASAMSFEVTAGETAGGKDAQLVKGGHITGTVTGPDSQGVDGVRVQIYRWIEDGEYWDPFDSTDTDEDGDYDIGGLPTGSYRLQFEDLSGHGYLTEYWNDAATLEAASTVSVTAAETVSGKNAQLAAGGHITGNVTDPDGQAAENVDVTAYRWVDEDEDWDYVSDVYTDEDGDYDIGALPTGTYRIEFDDASGDQLVTEYWNDATSLDTANDIAVVAGQTTIGKDAQLALPGRITGTVTGPGGGNLEDVYVTAYAWDAAGETWDYADADHTDGSGRYDIDSLPADTYRLEFDDDSDDYLTEYWDNATSLETANDIVVGAGATVAGKDAELADDPAPAVTNTAPPTISGTAQVGSTLTATTGSWEPSSDLAFGYRWLVAGAPVAGATASTYAPVVGDVGRTVQVEVTATRSGYTAGTGTSAATAAVVAATAPAVANVTLPAITGAPRVGTAVTATPGTWTPAGTTVAYQWFVAGAPVAGATSASYKPVAANAGKTLQLRVTATAAGHASATATSTVKTIGKGTLKATKKPKVTGKAKKNATLKVSPGTWSPKAKITYKWYAGAKAIPKATAARLKLAGKTLKAVKGKAISVLLTITAPGYGIVKTRLKVAGKVKR